MDCLPGEIRTYTKAAAESLQVPVGMIASFVLSVLSLSIQGKFEIQVKQDWTETVNLYLLVIARPSERKSPALKEVTSPIFNYTEKENERRRPKIQKYEMEKKILTGRLKTIQESLSKQGEKSQYDIQDALDCQCCPAN
ncbi:DUF3987 domain-containing protein [Muricomes intestini]|uniref:DUF3987 domain-containing protein n=1 Tax=Muricomes intestini TaxID=1796634 RepID=UPI0014052079|nr:DUF3987 domain-containing protein [Muricomes intestini]